MAPVRRKTSKLVVDDVDESSIGGKRKKGMPETPQNHNLEVSVDMQLTGKILNVKKRDAKKNGIDMSKMTLRETLAPEKGVTMLEAEIETKK